ncbi:MAG TPA: hypothetical protein VKX17_25270 [Planctomycetota bacterium]|nr:hypothetical protein [Planctomycetota bacterium]
MADELNPRDAIGQFLKQRLTGTQLLRSLALYHNWRIPARLEGLVPVYNSFDLGHGSTHFFLFSDKDAYLQCRNQIGISIMGEYYIDNVAGHNAFASIGPEVTVVNINPYSEREIHYTLEQIPRLRAWSQIVRTEAALDAAQTDNTGHEAIREFPGYYFIMEDEQYIALVPDGRGRKFAALFTSDDALELYLQRYGKPNMKPVPISGAALFKAIRNMPLDGLVFNCSGPTKAKAFPLAFAHELAQQ